MTESPASDLENYLRDQVRALKAALREADERLRALRERLERYEVCVLGTVGP